MGATKQSPTSFRFPAEERAMLEALADAEEVSTRAVLSRLIRREWAKRRPVNRRSGQQFAG